ncbi:hypothetical protein F4V91_10230 [Neorhizobium galegae]|uniref:Uncharacterized protein n=1 Tax=Neorhizobium galegae TaxID=399 RepID=A0A6A1TQJ0_NEOGA|nr:hypothetical protein [Neorhizobium galegae]KAB1086769.1 hypothetical protein F4V91_10230 [Neorhizobium galegae]
MTVSGIAKVSKKLQKTPILVSQRTNFEKNGSNFATESAVLRGIGAKPHYFFESGLRVWHDNCIGMGERVTACFKREAEI